MPQGYVDGRWAMTTRPAAAAPDLAEIAARYVPVDWEQAFAGQPDHVDWLIPDLIEVGTANALFGKPGADKSMLALDWAASLAAAGRAVLYLDHENRVSDVVERLQAFGYKPSELTALRFYSFADLPPP